MSKSILLTENNMSSLSDNFFAQWNILDEPGELTRINIGTKFSRESKF